MKKEKLSFADFISSVPSDNQKFVTEMHEIYLKSGCTIEVKEAKSGFVVSYLLNKKTIANYVFRKKGLLIRIYANHILQYMEIFDDFPDEMVRGIKAAPICKRMADPNACNPKCAMGYDFLIQGERVQKCRYNAFQFFVCEENNPAIRSFVEKELQASL